MSTHPAAEQIIAEAKYVSLVTFRKTGAKVATPVWIAPDLAKNTADAFEHFVFSEAKAGKIKRLRNSPEASIAPCTATGKLTGEAYPAQAHIIEDAADIARALAALRQKYGWQMWLADMGAKLTKRYDARAYIRITLNTVAHEGESGDG